MSRGVRFSGVDFAFSASEPLLADFSLELAPGTVTAVVGASGCGKSTLLRLAAGLLLPSGGKVEGAGTPGRTAFVFQSPTLLPWRSVAANVGLPLEVAGLPVQERDARVVEALEQVELTEAADQLPHALSGGMRMRAALARAFLVDPEIMLLDEPFSALDALTRQRAWRRFLDLWADSGATVVLVTHDLDEAVLLSDRVVVVGGRPLVVRGSLEVDLARPRALELRHDPRLGARVAKLAAWL